MSLLIKGMTAEELLDVFQWARTGANNCMIGHGVVAMELPDHGDLIDRDALMARYAEEVNPSNNSDFMRPPRWNDAVQLTELAPAVIPAERNENPCDNCDYRSDTGCSWCRRYERSEEDDSRENELISICSQEGVAWDDEVFYNELHRKQETK